MIKYWRHTLVCLLCLFLGSQSIAEEANSFNPVKVGGSLESLNDRSITDAEIAFQLLFNEILAEIDISFTIKIFEDEEILIKKFERGDVKALFLNTLGFLAIEDTVHPTARYVVQYGPQLKQRYLVLARSSDKSLDLSSFHRRKLSVSTGHLVGQRFLDVVLMEQGLPESDNFFGHVDTTNDSNTAIVDLFFHNTDLALVPESSFLLAQELNPQIKKTITVLEQSEPMIYQVVGLSRDFPAEMINKFEPFLLTETPSDQLKKVMRTFRITGLKRVDETTLQEVKAINERYQIAKGRSSR